MGLVLLNSMQRLGGWPESPGRVLIDQACWKDLKVFAGLSGRELQVCRLIFQGDTRKSAAEALGISERTVRHHLETIYSKLSVNNRVDLVLRLIQIRDHLEK